jgi:signal transduction histidine kinase
MHSLPSDIKSLSMGKRAFWTGALLSSIVGLLFYGATANTIERDAQARFNNMARGVQTTINGRVKSYSDVLRGSASLFQSSNDLTREQFYRYVKGLSLEQEFPGIETINFARYFTDAERAAFEQTMRADYPPFTITPPGRRPTYTVITYMEPMAGWANRIGIDFTAGGEVASLNVSRDTGQVSASGRPLANLPGPKRTGLAMRLPIYRSNMPANTVEERRAAYIGTVGIGFNVQKLIEGVLDQMPVPGVRLTLMDIGRRNGNTLEYTTEPSLVLFDSVVKPGMKPPPIARPDRGTFVSSLPVGYNRRLWDAHFSIAKTNLYTGFDAYVPWLAMMAGFVSTMLLYVLFHTLTAARRTAVALAEGMTKELRASEHNLQRMNENLRRLSAHAENIKEEERRRIAREIHDDLGQNLLALRIEADILCARTGDRHPRLHARARATVNQIDATIKSVRQIINDLRPNVLDLGLNAAVDWQIAEFRRRTGLECDLTETHQDIPVSDHCATALFRILQESLSNILRHANATRVQVVLRVERDWIWMSVGDNGIGFHPQGRHKTGSFGLVGIEERINILGGTCEIHSDPGSGTTIRVAVPLRDYFKLPISLEEPDHTVVAGAALV